jgi:3-dehydroquinate synthase class II
MVSCVRWVSKTVTALVGRYKIKTRERLLVEMRLEEREVGERLV